MGQGCLEHQTPTMGFHDGPTDFGAFYERTYQAALRIAHGIVGEQGMAQDAYVDAYRIVVNGAVSALWRRWVRLVQPFDPAVTQRPGGPDVASAVIDRVVLADGLQRLDARARSAVVRRAAGPGSSEGGGRWWSLFGPGWHCYAEGVASPDGTVWMTGKANPLDSKEGWGLHGVAARFVGRTWTVYREPASAIICRSAERRRLDVCTCRAISDRCQSRRP